MALAKMNTTWVRHGLWSTGGFGIIPTKCVGNFEDQLGSPRSSSKVINRRLLEVVLFVLRRTTRRRKGVGRVVDWRLLGVGSCVVCAKENN